MSGCLSENYFEGVRKSGKAVPTWEVATNVFPKHQVGWVRLGSDYGHWIK